MTNRTKALSAMGLAAIALIAYLAATARLEQVKDENSAPPRPAAESPKRPPVDLARLEAEYKAGMKAKIAEAELAIAETGTARLPADGAARLSELKIGLLDLTVPEEYRAAHLDFVLALSKVKTALEQADPDGQADGVALFKSALAKNEWLKN